MSQLTQLLNGRSGGGPSTEHRRRDQSRRDRSRGDREIGPGDGDVRGWRVEHAGQDGDQHPGQGRADDRATDQPTDGDQQSFADDEATELAAGGAEQRHDGEGAAPFGEAEGQDQTAGGGREDPSRFKLMLISQLEDPGLVVLPTHRLVRAAEGHDLAGALATLAQRGWKWVPAGDTAELLDFLATTPGPNHVGFGLYAAGRPSYWEGMIVGPEVELLPRSVAALDVALIQHGILAPLLGIGEEALAAGTHVAYARDAGEVIARVDSGEFDFGLLLRPPTLAQIQAVADAGESMPQKSTYFWPKPASGLVMALQRDLPGEEPG